jgi:hypothetical protein
MTTQIDHSTSDEMIPRLGYRTDDFIERSELPEHRANNGNTSGQALTKVQFLNVVESIARDLDLARIAASVTANALMGDTAETNDAAKLLDSRVTEVLWLCCERLSVAVADATFLQDDGVAS